MGLVFVCIKSKEVRGTEMKVTLTMQDVIVMLRKEYQLPADIQVEIEGFSEVNTTSTAVDGWIDVPSDWSEPSPTPEASECRKIEVIIRDGSVDKGYPHDWGFSWVQENNPYDIVKFRKMA